MSGLTVEQPAVDIWREGDDHHTHTREVAANDDGELNGG